MLRLGDGEARDPDAFDVVAQRLQLDGCERLHIVAIGQGQVVELGCDGFGGQGIDIAPQGKIDDRFRPLVSPCT